VIENVLPYLLPPNFVRSYVNVSNEEDSDRSFDESDDDDDELDNEDNENIDVGWEENEW
jgi:hypothetical protein